MARSDTRLLFLAKGGHPSALQPWRWREPSLSIAAGMSLFELSRMMGTSPATLDKTYALMLPDALDRARAALDMFISVPKAVRRGEPEVVEVHNIIRR